MLDAWTSVWLSPEFSAWSLKACIGKLICPVLAIHSDKDEYGSNAFPEFIADKAGGISETLIIHDCGHMPHKVKTHTVIKSVKKFIAANGL